MDGVLFHRIPAREPEENEIIFRGGMYVGKNTTRSANVRAQRVRCSRPQNDSKKRLPLF